MKVVPEGALVYVFNDVNEAYPTMHREVNLFGVEEETRNGKAIAMTVPVCLTHNQPHHRVLFDPKRDANPFFHYMESIWMLAGSRNVDFPARFAKNIIQYSDDGTTLRGAYGHRWRVAYSMDQIDVSINMLKDNPSSRRVVIGMWDPDVDLDINSKDLPCNTQLYLRIVDDRLTLTVLNRSNDLVWGMLGANIVHMSILQEYMAHSIGVEVGPMYQFSNNVHIYEDWRYQDKVSEDVAPFYREDYDSVIFGPATLSIEDAYRFVEDPDQKWEYWSRIINLNAKPMWETWKAYKKEDLDLAYHLVQKVYDDDWRKACREWIKRRMK